MKSLIMLRFIKNESVKNDVENYKKVFENAKSILKQTSIFDEQVFEAIRCYTLGNKKVPTLSVLTKVVGVANSYFSKAQEAFGNRIKELNAERRKEF